MRLIDADAMKRVYQEVLCNHVTCIDCSFFMDDKYCRFETMLSEAPTVDAADVAPVRHGRWEWCKDYYGDSILVCSECGRVCHEEDAPYCYCGAKMDLEG